MNIFKDRFSEIKKASEPLYKSPKSVQEINRNIKRYRKAGYLRWQMESIQRHTDSVMSIMPHVQRMNRKASFRDTAGALTHLTVHSR